MSKLISVIILSCISLFAGSGLSRAQSWSKLDAFHGLLQKHYVDTVDTNELIEAAIRAELRKLDPHSMYFNPEEFKAVNERLKGNYEGIGVQYVMVNDTLIITHIIHGGPAFLAGLQGGDRIIAVNQDTLAGVPHSHADIRSKLAGERGSSLSVLIDRAGYPDLLEFQLTRDKIPVKSIETVYWLNDSTAYIKLSRFGATTSREWKRMLRKQNLEEAKALILDVQSNGGGYLNAAVDLVNEFLEENQLIVYTEGRGLKKQLSLADKRGKMRSVRLAVLVDERSASASEILAGAIQDWDRGIVLGRRSFGKGSVQRQFVLNDQSAVRITVAQYFTPSGRSIQKAYNGNLSDYHNEVSQRLQSGELFTPDYPQENLTELKTLRHERSIWAGGGIQPDVFVPLDSIWINDTWQSLQRKALLLPIAVQFIDRQRDSLLQIYPDIAAFQASFNQEEALWQFALSELKEDLASEEIANLPALRSAILLRLRVQIASALYGREEAIRIENEENRALTKALELINNPEVYRSILQGEYTP